MKAESYIHYQGSKSNIIDFIVDGIHEYSNRGDTILDIFAGSGAVSFALSKNYNVIANDVEPYSATINKAMLKSLRTKESDVYEILNVAFNYYKFLLEEEELSYIIEKEQQYLREKNLPRILELYSQFPTIWNSAELTVEKLRESGRFNLFTRYYGGSYFGIKQAMEIDSIVYSVRERDFDKDFLYSCLFYAMRESVFSKDGHMAQPLNFEKFSKRGFSVRRKSIFEFFRKKFQSITRQKQTFFGNNSVYQLDFKELLKNEKLIQNIDLIYADPPYTDMQYSRYYHLLNVAKSYDFPSPTISSRGFTTGLYTEGRFQSELSQKSKAKNRLKFLMEACKKNKINLALSYAYPKNAKIQAVDRYTVSIEELIEMAQDIFGHKYVQVKQTDHFHANNKNSASKPVIEYLILCGKRKTVKPVYDISNVKNHLLSIKPTNRNPMYNTHLYWSQKSFNVINTVVKLLSEPGEIVFDPFMGSGVTVFEAVKKGTDRVGIGCDINEMPIFIVETLLESIFNNNALEQLRSTLDEIESLNSYYQLSCPICGHIAIVDRVIFDKPKRNENKVYIKTVRLNCSNCSIQNSTELAHKCLYQMYYPYSLKVIDADYKFIKNSKVAVMENDKLSNIFTSRNLKVIDDILHISQSLSKDAHQMIKYVLMSILHQCKITDKRSNSQWPLWIPKRDCVERNVVTLFTKKMTSFLEAQKFIKSKYHAKSLVKSFKLLNPNKALLFLKGSQHITETDLPSDSVDLIITDPPYLGQVLYSEYMQLYAPILKLKYDLNDEIVVSSGQGRNKDKDSYYLLLNSVFEMCSQKLKQDRYLCLFFHDSDLSVWSEIVDSLYSNGFHFKGQVHIKKNATIKNIISPKKSLGGDSILFFVNTKLSRPFSDGKESIEEIEANIIKETKYMLKSYLALSTQELYDKGLMEILIQNGWLRKMSMKYKSLVDLFEKHIRWDRKIGKWVAK